MERLTRHSALSGLLALTLTGAATALPALPHQRAEIFAVCAGRLTALGVHENAVRAPNATRTGRAAADFEVLLGATLPDALAQGLPSAQAQRWQTQGWVEVARLLAEVQYSANSKRAVRAQAQLQSRVETCLDLVLPGSANS